MRIPLLAGAGGKAMLSLLSDDEIDRILSKHELKRFTPFSCTNKRQYKSMILETRKTGIAFDMEEYIEGIRALAVPLNFNGKDIIAAIWAVGLRDQIKDDQIGSYASYLKRIAEKLETQF